VPLVASVATVLVDAENVRRSVWPNLSREDLGELAAAWAAEHGHDVEVVWETNETADDSIARAVRELEPPIWVVTSDRELRHRVERYVERILGGGSFACELQTLQ
jgi:predicted RNA-binding protein with PIN domain